MKKTLSVLMVSIVFAVTANAQMQILTTEEAPTNFTQNGNLIGIVVDVVEELKKATGENATIKSMPWARTYDTALKLPNILVFTLAKTPERVDAGFQFIGPVVTRKHTLYKKKGDPLTLTSVDDVKTKNLTVGAMRGDWRGKFFMDMGVKVEEVVSNDRNLKKLQLGRIPLIILSDLELNAVSGIAGVNMAEFEPALVFAQRSSFMAFSKETPKDVVDKWQKAFTDLQKGDFFAKTAKKWGDALGNEMYFLPEKGLFIK